MKPNQTDTQSASFDDRVAPYEIYYRLQAKLATSPYADVNIIGAIGRQIASSRSLGSIIICITPITT